MKRISPFSYTLRAVAGLALSLGLLGGALAQAPEKKEFTAEAKEEVLTQINKIISTNAYVPGVDFSKWEKFVEGEKEKIDGAKSEREFTAAINGALRKFGFSHIVLMSPEAATNRVTRKVVGVGIQLEPEEEGLRVINVFEKSPADEAGLKVGDLVIEGNGKPAKNPAELAGEAGSVLKLKVKKIDGSTKDYSITRREYSNVRPEKLAWVNDHTAMVTIPTFDLSYNRTRVTELMKEASKAKSLILDLRSNGGGAVVNLTHLMGHLLPERTPLGTFVDKGMVKSYVEETGGKETDLAKIAEFSKRKLRAGKVSGVEPFKGNIVVLINGGSGSASEIAAAMLKEASGAQIIGSKSAGAVLVSVMAPLPNKFVLQFPLSDYVTMAGIRLEGNGIVPNIEVPESTKFGGPDQAVEKAVAFLQKLQKNKGDRRN